MGIPVACRPEAFELFAAQVPQLETTPGLMRAAIAISMHAEPELDPSLVEEEIGRIGATIRRRVTGASSHGLLAHLHHELFERRGFRGNVEDYYNPGNSFLPVVLKSERGIPITLSLVYKLVANRIGLRAEGINAPGHFLAQVHSGARPMLIDAFHGGRVLTAQDAHMLMEQATGRKIPFRDSNLQPATHMQWIARMLQNLVSIFINEGRGQDVAAMSELGQLLGAALY